MKDEAKTKEQLVEELAELRRQADKDLKREGKIRVAEAAIRARVAEMDQIRDLYTIVEELHKHLKELGINQDSASLQIVNLAGTDFLSFPISEHRHRLWDDSIDKIIDPSWQQTTNNAKDYPWVIEVWKTGKPRYVLCTTEASNMPPGMSLLDVPFSHGTLAINSKRPNAFREEDIPLLQRFANVITDGYQRFLDIIKLRHAEWSLQKAYGELELRVEERTAELFRANEDLQGQVAERRRAEKELMLAKEEAEAANRAKSAFLANMSHELRTPLNAILGFAQLLNRGGGLAREQQENLEIISRSGEHLLALINDVLEISKIEAGRTVLKEQAFDLHRLLDGLEDMFSMRAGDKGLLFAVERDPDLLCYACADEGKLRQVLINLLGNAVKFTQKGEVTLRVRSIQEADTTRLFFEVEDSGPGIASADLGSLFDAFVQTVSGQKAQEGTGLGLPISQQFVRLMSGEIAVSSREGEGSVFSFDIQVDPARADEVETMHLQRRVVGLEPDQPEYRILVVEDLLENRKLLVNLLEPMGFAVREATDGREGIEVWQEWRPHLIWMDMRMPVMDGHEATRRIKATDQGRETVIVALTASVFEEEHAVVLAEGCDGFVRKPFREEEIFEVIARLLGVLFVYEESAQPPARPASSASAGLDPAALAGLPVEWIAQLRQGALLADGDLIAALLEQIKADHSDLADALADLVRDFRFDRIIEFLQSDG